MTYLQYSKGLVQNLDLANSSKSPFCRYFLQLFPSLCNAVPSGLLQSISSKLSTSLEIVSEINQGMALIWKRTFAANWCWRKYSPNNRSVKSSKAELSQMKSIIAVPLGTLSRHRQTLKVSSTKIYESNFRTLSNRLSMGFTDLPDVMDRSQRLLHKHNWNSNFILSEIE